MSSNNQLDYLLENLLDKHNLYEDFCKELMKSIIYVPIKDGKCLSIINKNNHKKYLMFFSSFEGLKQSCSELFGENHFDSYQKIIAKNFFLMNYGSDFVFNPGLDINKEFNSSEIAHILFYFLGNWFEPFPKGVPVLFHTPKLLPSNLLESISRVLKKSKHVNALYYSRADFNYSGIISREIIGVDASLEIVRDIDELKAELSNTKENIDFSKVILINLMSEREISQQLQQGFCFYKKIMLN